MNATKKDLVIRAQMFTKSCVAYIQDVFALCHKADSDMCDLDKAGHVLQGIADDAFNLPMCKNCATVGDIIKECQCFE